MAGLPTFRIETFEDPSGTTIKVTGELDSATCAGLLLRFQALVESGDGLTAPPARRDAGLRAPPARRDAGLTAPPARSDAGLRAPPARSDAGLRAPPARSDVVLDLSGVSFIDSSGMRAIILLERSAEEHGVSLTIVPPPEAISGLMLLTGVTEHVAIAPGDADEPPAGPFIERIDLELNREPTAPARARAELREAFGNRLSDGDRATATLLTSELVTNAVIHPAPGVGGSIGLRITAYPDRIRVEVSDAGSGFDAGNLPPRPREDGGHGLIVVNGLSSRWGTSRRTAERPASFCVWFELDAESAAEAAGDGAKATVATAEG